MCYGVLELMKDEEQDKTPRLFADCMDADSRLFLSHTNWHPLNARTLSFFWRSLRDRETFGSARKTHDKYRFVRSYGSYRDLLRRIGKAQLLVENTVKGPYLAAPWFPWYEKYLDGTDSC